MGFPMNESERQLTEFARREYGRLVRATALCCPPGVASEEIAQEALLQLCRHWRRVARMEYPEAWLYRVALNLASTERARTVRRQRAATAWMRSQQTVAITVDPADSEPLRAAVQALPGRQQQAIVCRFFLDLSVADTAAVLNCAQGTVRALTAQAMTSLRRVIDKPLHEPHREARSP